MQETGQLVMRRSKLEIQVDILKALARHRSLKLTHIMYKANINCSILKEYLDFLVQHGLVKEQEAQKKRVTYSITKRGKTVLEYFSEVDRALQITKDANKIPAALY